MWSSANSELSVTKQILFLSLSILSDHWHMEEVDFYLSFGCAYGVQCGENQNMLLESSISLTG